MTHTPADVAVIGGGVVGLCCAASLLRDGHRVTLVEPGEPGGRHGASFGNGAWLSPASVVPMSMPGLWRRVPGFLADPLGPLTIRPSALPRLAPWLLRFLLAGATVGRVERTARALAPLLAASPERHAALASEAGVPELIRRDGLLYAYPSRADFAAEALGWRLRGDNGVEWTELDAPALHALVPTLSRHYGFGVLVGAGGHCTDPGAYLAALAEHLTRLGMATRRARARGFAIRDGALAAVLVEGGEVPCTRAVVAAGIRSAPLARAAGDRIPLAAERGYHAVVAGATAGPPLPVMPSDGKQANTPTRAGLRVSGQVELAAVDAPPDWRRAAVLLAHALDSYEGLRDEVGPVDRPNTRVGTWMGHRPSTPDGLPVIGLASRYPDVIYAFGHGHVGLAAAPATAALVAALASGAPVPEAEPYSPRRFRWRVTDRGRATARTAR